jgi:hypothetical protein
MQEPQQGGISAADIAKLKAVDYDVLQDKDTDPPTFYWLNTRSTASQLPSRSLTEALAWQAANDYYSCAQ